MNRGTSEFENEVFDYLDRLGIRSERNYKAGKWTFDGRLRGTHIIVEADGDYWHSSSKVIERDARKNKWCLENGFELIRVRYSDFRKDAWGACLVIVDRWQKLTGEKAVREGVGGNGKAVRKRKAKVA